jgi:mono/diheme cytochrome c family protein
MGIRGIASISVLRVKKRSFNRLTAAAAYFAAAAVTATATTTLAGPPQNDAGSDQAQIDQGKMTFAQKCSHCHGFNMVNSGTIAPDLRRFPDDRERFFTTVKLGKNGKMPPWGDLLSDDQIACLWAYISSRRD